MQKNDITYQFHHMGIPTDTPQENERYSSRFNMFTSDGKDEIIRIQYHRFEPNCPLHPLIKNKAHVAFKVNSIDKAIEGRKVLLEPYFPFERFRVAFVEIDGAPIEFIETDLSEEEVWSTTRGKSYLYPEGVE